MQKLKDGDLIEVGYQVKSEGAFGVQWFKVSRVTPKFAFVAYSERAEGKFKRTYRDFGFCPLPPEKWRTTQYSAWRPIE